ncbi:hypothetical protein LAZ67_9002705 [Cordylochernes scorpioides]|uniref:Transposase n=1 Tax=Cordylochernes scorpioides TaxID=51811 RepID=A0ABY6KU00_9ARAC|nr:hypothetical protein LAZ67_9002705 [Cordylochernes scorpioides]
METRSGKLINKCEEMSKDLIKHRPGRTTVFEWHSRFKAGRISIEDDPRQGRPKFQRTDENAQKITDLIKENLRTTLLELEQDTGISKTTIGRIVTEDLKLKKTPAKVIPRFLTNEQNLCRLATCEDMLEMTRTDPEWKDKIITGDETWVYGYDPEAKRHSAEWRGQGEPRPKKSRILKSRNKVLLDNKGIVHHEYLPAGQTVIKEMFLAKNRTQILPQPPYSPDIAPNDFFLFPKLKAVLKRRHFDTRDDKIEKSLMALKSILKEAYKNCFDNWEKRWRWCVEARGDYFENLQKKLVLTFEAKNLICTLCDKEITEELPHYLLNCTALDEERKALYQQIKCTNTSPYVLLSKISENKSKEITEELPHYLLNCTALDEERKALYQQIKCTNTSPYVLLSKISENKSKALAYHQADIANIFKIIQNLN